MLRPAGDAAVLRDRGRPVFRTAIMSIRLSRCSPGVHLVQLAPHKLRYVVVERKDGPLIHDAAYPSSRPRALSSAASRLAVASAALRMVNQSATPARAAPSRPANAPTTSVHPPPQFVRWTSTACAGLIPTPAGDSRPRVGWTRFTCRAALIPLCGVHVASDGTRVPGRAWVGLNVIQPAVQLLRCNALQSG
jgi:hypothetical protein